MVTYEDLDDALRYSYTAQTVAFLLQKITVFGYR
jgi:hypothetical protein